MDFKVAIINNFNFKYPLNQTLDNCVNRCNASNSLQHIITFKVNHENNTNQYE